MRVTLEFGANVHPEGTLRGVFEHDTLVAVGDTLSSVAYVYTLLAFVTCRVLVMVRAVGGERRGGREAGVMKVDMPHPLSSVRDWYDCMKLTEGLSKLLTITCQK